MFQRLFDYRYQRTGLQAFGFYIAYLIPTFVLAFIAGIFIGQAFWGGPGFQAGLSAGALVCVIVSFALGFAVLAQKRRMEGSLVALAILGGLLGGASALFGLIPVAFLTRLQPGPAEVLPSEVPYSEPVSVAENEHAARY